MKKKTHEEDAWRRKRSNMKKTRHMKKKKK